MYEIKDHEEIISPQLIYYKNIIDQNIDKAVNMAHTSARLWPHVKAHKIPQMVNNLVQHGITKFKCATIAECEMVANTSATDILLAYPLIGPNIKRYIKLQQTFREKKFYAIGDNLEQIKLLSKEAVCAKEIINFFIDVNMGMNRTGVPIEKLSLLADGLKELNNIQLCGLHCYDGNHNDKDLIKRREAVDTTMNQLRPIVNKINKDFNINLIIIAGGSPAFPCYDKYEKVYCSPGTLFVNDYGYECNLPDMKYQPAACILTRVISHPNKDIFTIDCGYKAIASDPKVLRGEIVGLSDKVDELFQSEEHWVFKMKPGYEQDIPKIGDTLYIVPTHICPTTALYPFVLVAEKGQIIDKWDVVARNRKISI